MLASRKLAVLCCFFFFQAEDGIRDIGVTGVQTCALPILLVADGGADAVAEALQAGALDAMMSPVHFGELRSEERRVGKECRARWAPDQEKKKKDKLDNERRGRRESSSIASARRNRHNHTQ